MHLEINSVWKVSGIDQIADGQYRVLQHSPETGNIILFDLKNEKQLKKPVLAPYDIFVQGIKEERCNPITYAAPYYQLTAEESIPKEHKIKRDKNWELIKALVNQPDYLQRMIASERNNFLTKYAKSKGTYVQKIYRLLNLYWQFGQQLNSLLPAYKFSGGPAVPELPAMLNEGLPQNLFSRATINFG